MVDMKCLDIIGDLLNIFIVGAVLFIKTNYIVEGNYFIYSLIIAVMVVFNHRENVKRLLSGTENKLSFKK